MRTLATFAALGFLSAAAPVYAFSVDDQSMGSATQSQKFTDPDDSAPQALGYNADAGTNAASPLPAAAATAPSLPGTPLPLRR